MLYVTLEGLKDDVQKYIKTLREQGAAVYEESGWEDWTSAFVIAKLVVNLNARDFYTNHWMDTLYPHFEFGPVRLHHSRNKEDGWYKWIYLISSDFIESMKGLSNFEGTVYRCADGVFAIEKGKLKKVKVSKGSNLPLVECIDDGFVKLFHCFVPSDVYYEFNYKTERAARNSLRRV